MLALKCFVQRGLIREDFSLLTKPQASVLCVLATLLNRPLEPCPDVITGGRGALWVREVKVVLNILVSHPHTQSFKLFYRSLSSSSSDIPNFVKIRVYKILWIHLLFQIILEVSTITFPPFFPIVSLRVRDTPTTVFLNGVPIPHRKEGGSWLQTVRGHRGNKDKQRFSSEVLPRASPYWWAPRDRHGTS